jgi:DNA (cytosine-5)-methyltransferase 1
MKGCFNVEITFAEMYSGIAGVRHGLEKTNQISIDSESRFGSEERQPSKLPERRGIEERRSGSGRECVDSQPRIGSAEGQYESLAEGGDGRQFKEFRCVWANDIDKYACQIYRKHYGDKELVEGDIRTIDSSSMPDFDLLTAGFPCQSFSLAGKRKGFQDIRGTLFYEIVRVASTKRPKLLLLENVKGLLSNDNGKTFGTLLESLGDIGYWLEWQTLNSKHFGVPQNRERVFIIGHSRAEPTRQIFPIGQANSLASKKASREQEQVSTCIDSNYWKGADKHGQRTVVLQEHSFSGEDGRGRGVRTYQNEVPALTQQMGTGGNNVPMVVADRTRSYAKKGRNLESPKDFTNALSGVQKDNLVLAVETAHTKANMKEGRFSKECHTLDGGKSKAVMILGNIYPSNGEAGKIVDTNGIFPTLKQGKRGGKAGIPPISIANAVDCDGYLRYGERPRDENGKPQLLPIGVRRIRRLTPIECERLQGFPDGWTEGVSDTQRYKLLGNAVTTNVIAFLGEKLKGCIE